MEQTRDNASPGSLRGWEVQCGSAAPPTLSLTYGFVLRASYPTLLIVHEPKRYWIEAKDFTILWRNTPKKLYISFLLRRSNWPGQISSSVIVRKNPWWPITVHQRKQVLGSGRCADLWDWLLTGQTRSKYCQVFTLHKFENKGGKLSC